MNVLVVDDSRTIRSLECRMLRELGVSGIAEAGDGLEALGAFELQRPDLVLLDWNMPVMDGLTFLRALGPEAKATRVIMVTSEAEARRVTEAISAGAVDYIVKPFTRDVFIEKVKRHVGAIAA